MSHLSCYGVDTKVGTAPLTSMYLDADEPMAKENDTKRVDMETNKGQGLKFNKLKMTSESTNLKA